MLTKVYSYCRTNQYGSNNEYCLNHKSMRRVKRILKGNSQEEKRKNGFSDEEIFALGLYPKNDSYKMSVFSRILEKENK